MSAAPLLWEDAEAPLVEIVIPVHNERAVLVASVDRLRLYLTEHLPLPWRITVADNASTDGTLAIAQRLADASNGEVRAVHLDRKGRGRALRQVWLASDAAVVAYMDVDLSTDLDALFPLIAPLLSGHSDAAIGSRLARGATVQRGLKREVLSRGYNRILHSVFRNRFTDAQCGFKAIRRDVAHLVLPHVVDEGWFFDTELLLLVEHNGLRVHEVAVDWTDDLDSRVDIPSTVAGDLRGVWRMASRFARGGGRIDVKGLSRLPQARGRHLLARHAGRGGHERDALRSVV